ncbi:hypothetical protein COCC4DRAFT_118471, partial [Bipolaris maydis ATCC 48331]
MKIKVESFGRFACRSQLVRKRGEGEVGKIEIAKTDQSQATIRRQRQCDETVAIDGHQLAEKDEKKLAEQEKNKKKGMVKVRETQHAANAITLKRIVKRCATLKANLRMISV